MNLRCLFNELITTNTQVISFLHKFRLTTYVKHFVEYIKFYSKLKRICLKSNYVVDSGYVCMNPKGNT